MPTNFWTWFWPSFWMSGWNNQQMTTPTKQQKFPWLSDEQIKRLESLTPNPQEQQKLYQQAIQQLKQQTTTDNRIAAENEMNYRSMNEKNPQQANYLQSNVRLEQLADLTKWAFWLDAGADTPQVVNWLMAMAQDNGVSLSLLNDYLDHWDEEFLYQMGLKQDPALQTNPEALSIKGSIANANEDKWEWNDNFFGRLETKEVEEWAWFWKNAGRFLGNVAKSGVNVLSDVWNMILNPLDTANALAKTAVWAGMNLLGTDDDIEYMQDWKLKDWYMSANETADTVWQFFKERYGGGEEILNTLFTDPVWVISDVATILEWWAWAVRWIAKWWAKATAKAWLKGTARTLENVAEWAGKVSKVAATYDPYAVAMRAEVQLPMKAISTTVDVAKKIPWAPAKMKNSLNIALDKAVGLDEKTKLAIQSNPFSKEVWQKAKTYIDANWLPEKSQEVSKQLITDVADRVQETMLKQMDELGETWPMYQPLREAWYTVDLAPAKAKLPEVLDKYGITVDENGKLDFSKTAISSEAKDIQKLYNWLENADNMSMDEYLRFRSTAKDMVTYNPNNKSQIWKKIADTPWDQVIKAIREAANETAHEQVAPLKDLDALYKKQSDLIQEVTDWIVYKDASKAGTVRDNINQIIKNLDEPNRRVLKNRLEKVLPWIEEEVKAINMLPKLIDRYYKPSKRQQTLTSSAWAAVWGTFGWLPWGILWAWVGYWLSSKIDKLKSAKWEKVISGTSKEWAEKLADIQKRIANNERITTAQRKYLQEISTKLKNDKDANLTRIIAEVAWAEDENMMAVLDKAIKELDSMKDTQTLNEIKELRDWLQRQIDEDANMTRANDEFIAEMERAWQEWADQRLPEFKRRIYQLQQQEKRIWAVANKKIWKTFEWRDFKNRQNTEWLKKKEWIIKDIEEYYNVDQFEASNIFDRIERQAWPDDVGFNKSQASSKTAKYQVAEEEIKPNATSPEELSHVNEEGLSVMDSFVSKKQELKAKNVSKDLLDSNGNPYLWTSTNKYKTRVISDFRNVEDSKYKAFSDQGKEIARFTNNADMSYSYADYKSILAPTKRFNSVEAVNKFFEENPNTYEKEFGNGGNLKSSQTYKIQKADNGYELIPESQEIVTQSMKGFYEDLNNDRFGNNIGDMPKNTTEALEKLQKYYEDNPYTDWEITIRLLDNGDVERVTIKTWEPVKRFETEQQAIAEWSTFWEYSEQYHYQGIIQDVKNPLVVDVKWEWNNPSLWNSLGNAWEFLRKNHKNYEAKFQNLKDKVWEALNERSSFSYWDLRKIWDAKDKAYEEYTKAKKERMGDNTAVDKAMDDMNTIGAVRENIESMLFNRWGKPMELTEKQRNYKITDTKTLGNIYDEAVKLYKKYEDTFSLDFKDRGQVTDYIAKYTDDTIAHMLRKNKLFDYEIDTIDWLRNHNLAYYIDDVDMTTNDYVFYALNDGRYDGVLFRNIKDYWWTPSVWWKDAKWGDVLAVFNSKQFKNRNNPDPTDSKYISYQKYWTAGKWEKWISAAEWLNIRNFKNWKTVQELANQYWIDTKIVDSISTPEWQRAYWMYWDRLITLSKDLKESTAPHELLHGVFDMVDGKRRTSILEWIQKKLNIDNVQAEEWLADNFSEYYRTGKFWTKWLSKWLVEKVKQFFYEVKSYIDWTYQNEKQIRQLFDDIIDWKIEWEYGVYSDPDFINLRHGEKSLEK